MSGLNDPSPSKFNVTQERRDSEKRSALSKSGWFGWHSEAPLGLFVFSCSISRQNWDPEQPNSEGSPHSNPVPATSVLRESVQVSFESCLKTGRAGLGGLAIPSCALAIH